MFLVCYIVIWCKQFCWFVLSFFCYSTVHLWVAGGNQFETDFSTCWVPVEASTFMLSVRFNQSMLCPRIRVRVVHGQVADSWSTYIDLVNPMVNVHLKLGMGYIVIHVYTTHSCYSFFWINYPQFPRISLTSWDLPWQKLIIWSNQGASPALRGRRWVKWQAVQMANAMAVHLAVGLEGPGWPLKKKWEEAGDLMKSGTFKNGLRNFDQFSIPIGSMYGIYSNIYHQYTPNVSIYTIHGSYG